MNRPSKLLLVEKSFVHSNFFLYFIDKEVRQSQ